MMAIRVRENPPAVASTPAASNAWFRIRAPRTTQNKPNNVPTTTNHASFPTGLIGTMPSFSGSTRSLRCTRAKYSAHRLQLPGSSPERPPPGSSDLRFRCPGRGRELLPLRAPVHRLVRGEARRAGEAPVTSGSHQGVSSAGDPRSHCRPLLVRPAATSQPVNGEQEHAHHPKPETDPDKGSQHRFIHDIHASIIPSPAPANPSRHQWHPTKPAWKDLPSRMLGQLRPRRRVFRRPLGTRLRCIPVPTFPGDRCS